MCGHVGVAGKLESKDEKLLKRLLIQDYFRGPDSTGFASLKLDGSSRVSKIASHPIDLFQMKSFTDALQGYSSSVFLGHNRFATKGVVNSYNAHPYEFDHIVGAHNGTLDKSSWDALHKKLDTEYPVDSMAIIASIAKFGIAETVKVLQGAWALVWIDKNEGTLNFLRNDQRTFWVAYSEDLKKIYWASEHPMIKAAIDLGPITDKFPLWKTKGEKTYAYFSTDVDVHYKIDLNVLIKGELDKDKQPDFRVRDKNGKIEHLYGIEPKPIVHHSGSGMYNHFPTNTRTGTTLTGTAISSSTTKSLSEDGSGTNVIHLKGDDFNPLADTIDRITFERYAKYGCSWCQADVEFGDVGISVFPEIESVKCAECSGNNGANKVYMSPASFTKVKLGVK